MPRLSESARNQIGVRIELTRSELDEIKHLQARYRSDWPAVFSANHHREIWLFRRRGLTPGEEREEVRGLLKWVDYVADTYLAIREVGGRFFIDERGAFYKNGWSQEIQFVTFLICG